MTKKIRVLIADDHPAFREGLCHFLEEEKDMEVVGKPADGVEAVRLVKELHPDVAIIDVVMPQLGGIEAAREIKAACPTTAILMLSAYDYGSYLLASLQAGVAGYILKGTPISELVSSIRLVHAGRAIFDLKGVKKVISYVAGSSKPGKRTGRLRQRELDVLELAAKGMTNKAIAGELGISQRTVQTHLFNIFRKLEVNSRTEAVFRALREGWLIPDDQP